MDLELTPRYSPTPEYPKLARGKQIVHRGSLLGGSTDSLPRITLCPASFYESDPIVLYEPPKGITFHLHKLFSRRKNTQNLSASYDSFSKPPSWSEYDISDKKPKKSRKSRCMSMFAFCLGFFLALASMLIAIGAVLTHKRLIQRDPVQDTNGHFALDSLLPINWNSSEETMAGTIDMFNSLVNNLTNSDATHWPPPQDIYVGLTSKTKTPGIDIEPKAARPLYNADIPYNILPWSILRFVDTVNLCFYLRNPRTDGSIVFKISRLHPASQSSSILLNRAALTALNINSQVENSTLLITAQNCQDVRLS